MVVYVVHFEVYGDGSEVSYAGVKGVYSTLAKAEAVVEASKRSDVEYSISHQCVE